MSDGLQGVAATLLGRYAWAIDDRAYDELEHVFTSDLTADYEAFQCRGVADLVGTMERIHRGLVATQHLVGSILVEPAPEGPGEVTTIRSHVQATLVRRVDGVSTRVVVGASYRDQMVQTDAGPRIADRRVRGRWVEGDRSILAWFPPRSADGLRPSQRGR